MTQGSLIIFFALFSLNFTYAQVKVDLVTINTKLLLFYF